MSLGERFKERLRLKLKRWIEREKAVTGCATKAVKNVAEGIGKSATWVYSIVNRNPNRQKVVSVEVYAVACFPKVFAKAGKALRITRKQSATIFIPEQSDEPLFVGGAAQ